MFPHAEVHVAPAILIRIEVARAVEGQICFVRFGEVRRAAHQPGNILCQGVEGFSRGFACGHAFWIGREARQVLVPAVRQLATLHLVQLIGELRKLFLVFLKFRLPCGAGLGAALPHAILELVINAIGDEKLGIFGPSVILLNKFDFGLAQGLAVCFVRILFVWRSVSDVAVHDDEGRPIIRIEKILVAASQHLQIVRIRDVRYVPLIALESRDHIFTERPLRRAIQRHAIVVVDPTKIRELQMTCERSRFAADAFHQIAISANGVNIEVENIEAGLIEILPKPFPGNGHAHAVSRTLPQRSGGGLNPGRQMRFGMSGSPAADLPEALDLLHRHGERIGHFAFGINCAHSGEVQGGVEQHRGVASR